MVSCQRNVDPVVMYINLLIQGFLDITIKISESQLMDIAINPSQEASFLVPSCMLKRGDSVQWGAAQDTSEHSLRFFSPILHYNITT